MRVLELSGQVMTVKKSVHPASLLGFLALEEISVMAGLTKKEEKQEEDGDDVGEDSNDGILIKSRPDRIPVGSGDGEDGCDRQTRQRGPMHNQVLKIKEEDSHLGEDVREVLTGKDKVAFVHHVHVTYQLWPRPVLPSSPLGANRTIKSFH